MQAPAAEPASKADAGKAPLGTARLRAAARGDAASMEGKAADTGAAEAQLSKRKQEAAAADLQTGRSITVRCPCDL